MRYPSIFNQARAQQRGAALLIMLVIMVTGVSAVLVNSLNSSTVKMAQQQNTAAALAQAKEALIGYAITYRDNGHPDDVFGYLPLPDIGSFRNNNFSSKEGMAAANFSGNTKNLTVIGRLPWRKLGIPPLRDGSGECLWYAVSGSFQGFQKADVLNWDSLGHFDVYSSNGTPSGTISTTGANYAQRPVAIIFAANAALQGQNRQASTDDNVDTCGGNYNTQNYLDSFSVNANLNNIVNYFTNSPNNSTGYAYNLTALPDGSQLDAVALSAPKNIIFGDIEVNIAGELVKIINDRILTITADDIFRTIIRRNDFKTQISDLMNDAQFTFHLQGIIIAGTKGATNINCDVIVTNIKNQKFCKNWKEMLLLKSTTGPCSRVLLFGGQKIAAQIRSTATDKDNPINYLEPPNLAVFAASIANSNDFIGLPAFNPDVPSADIVQCL